MTHPVKIINWNVEHWSRWQDAADWVRSQEPDLFFAQEVQAEQLDKISKRLGMEGYLAAQVGRSPNENAIFVRPNGPFLFHEEHFQTWAPWHAPANITVWHRGPDGIVGQHPISLVSIHTCYWSADVRLIEAHWCSTLAKPGWLAVIFGDWNSVRTDTTINWRHVGDAAYYANRTYLQDGKRHTDDRPDREMLAAGYLDLARYAAERGELEALAPTAGYGRPKHLQGGEQAIDRGYASRLIAEALTGYEVCKSDELERISDHRPEIALFDQDKLQSATNRPADTASVAEVTARG
ncbi:hypothetical protein C9F11_21065 [Streptomyces sp. YIM 121038]|uniref:endonuclease/exonuclease/phosphatase family protein n=1 Tax=Streptomyces sp. YIM 121038 TaxID=2136401 RepID=UPI0011104D22|nr:endonuclease/exonuclease/phosphatase family protein [Streptomyces sp. YIM 121038]QCX77845.1 hypothetical protein C9F11_21065 [Streptomyces sp. YIM 121038]